MNETLSSSIWPNFQNSRPNWSEQFSTNSMNTWQNNNSASSEYFQTTVDFNNVWSAKSEINDEGDKDSYIKSIWSTSTSPNHVLVENNIILNDNAKHVDATPTNSPSLNRSDIIVSNERWGNIKINQTTPWMVSEIDDSDKRTLDPMVWRAKIDGTEVWEEYYTKQHGKRRPQPDNSFNNENVWSSTSDISQSTNLLWSGNKSSEITSGVQTDIFGSNFFGSGGNSHSNFNNSTNNGVRPSMTRNQAQKYLQEMGFSLSDSIGALVNNQMDLPKALNELQSKYRMSTNNANISSNMCNQPLSFNRNTDNANIARIPSGATINPIVGQNTSSIPSIMSSNFPNNIDMFHSEISDQMLDSKYIMDQNMTAFNRMPDSSRQQSLNMARQSSFQNNYSNTGINNRSMSTNSGHFCNSDINLINQSMSRVNFNNAPANIMNQNNSFNIRPNNNSSGFNGMHNINNSNNTNSSNININNNNNNNNNNPNIMLNNNGNVDVRQNFAGMPNVYGRSISKPPIFPMNNSAMNWHADPSVMSPNGAIPDMSQLRLAKNLSCPTIPDKVIAIVIKKVQHKHIDLIKSLCMESGAMINFQLNPQAQSIIVQFTNFQEAYRYINIIQNQLSLRVEQINSQDEYMHYMSGAN